MDRIIAKMTKWNVYYNIVLNRKSEWLVCLALFFIFVAIRGLSWIKRESIVSLFTS
jgi:sugar phosphate permease